MRLLFRDRKDAGEQLGNLLTARFRDDNPIVLGIPCGGVECAFYVAQVLQAELSVLVSKRLPFPGHEELSFGAVSEDGCIFLSSLAAHVAPGLVYQRVADKLEEVYESVERCRKEWPVPAVKDRTVIVVDDGIMTGNTIIPVLQWCKEREVSKLIVAAPVASTTFFPELATLCDELHVLVQDDDLYSEGQVYACFPVLQDEHVHELLERFSPEFH